MSTHATPIDTALRARAARGWGPNLLGHHHPEVEAAAARQRALGDCLNGPTARMVELAERLVERIAHADWVMFQKNGTDATTVCLSGEA